MILNYPVYLPGTNQGAKYTVPGSSKIWTWTGYAWSETNAGGQTVTVLTATTDVIVNGNSVITTATTSTLHFLNTTNSTSTTTGAVVIDGGLAVAKDLWLGGTFHTDSVRLTDTIFDSTNSVVTTTNSTVIDQYAVGLYRTSKYLVQIDDVPTNSFQAVELLMLVSNTGTSYSTQVTEYAIVTNNGPLGTFEHQVVEVGSVTTAQLLFHATAATNKTVKVLRIAMTQ
jgi:hypothetical protein